MGVDPTIRRISGDGLSLNLRSNEQILEVTGDGCRITMCKNRGSVKIIGDGCRLKIDQNMGDVEYTGDGGQVLLGAKSVKDKVKYVGDGGSVSFAGESQNRKFKVHKKETVSREANERKKGAGKDRSGAKSREEADNDLNRGKEAKSGAEGCKEEKKGKTVKATIVTTLEYDEKIVKRWFVNPETVVRTLDGASFVKIVPKQTKTTIQNRIAIL